MEGGRGKYTCDSVADMRRATRLRAGEDDVSPEGLAGAKAPTQLSMAAATSKRRESDIFLSNLVTNLSAGKRNMRA